MKVYTTKYFMRGEGIFLAEGEPQANGNFRSAGDWRVRRDYSKGDWFPTLEEAIAHCEAARNYEIARCERRIAKLRGFPLVKDKS